MVLTVVPSRQRVKLAIQYHQQKPESESDILYCRMEPQFVELIGYSVLSAKAMT